MVESETRHTSGLKGLDKILKGIMTGDNIVWQVDRIDDYMTLVEPYCRAAVAMGRKLVYFRFASHPPVVPADCEAEWHEFLPSDGFETFIAGIHDAIEEAGRGAYYVFDCLSELAADWYSDRMLGNFFMLTCPYLYDMETITYFALFRDHHSADAIRPIANTTQLLLEAFPHGETMFIRPIKVQHRHSHTMNMLHAWEGEEFRPITASSMISDILASKGSSGLHLDKQLGYWDRAFMEAESVLTSVRSGQPLPERQEAVSKRLARMVISRDQKILELASLYISIEDMLDIRKRMIGTGLIGGKTVGMLLARAILKKIDGRFADLLETHDSFYVGSDVFYTFLVGNGIWWARQRQRNPGTFLDGADQARHSILTGSFPPNIVKQFEQMIDYFGQSPFIVRSSSLLEDNFGNSFAGKYESVFCANQGSRARRLEDFLAAVRTIYASSMSEKAMQYRESRGMLENDEQMALLIMRVSGEMYGTRFHPQIAGVGFSFNPYVWNKAIDPEAGVLRLVFGLGTRAVDRVDDDYTRVVALNAPEKRPEANFDEVCQYSQRRVDFLDLEANRLSSGHFIDIANEAANLPLDMFAAVDRAQQQRAVAGKNQLKPWILTFDKLLTKTSFVQDMRDLLRILEKAYRYPVDIEFTANFIDDQSYTINLVQCRPLQVKGKANVEIPDLDIPEGNRIIEARGAVIGHSRQVNIDRFVYVSPDTYGALPVSKRYEVARLIGDLNRTVPTDGSLTVMMLGPGRWGTSSPSLGIPVSYADINRTAIICEIVAMRDNLVPDVSLGTHFLNELVEMDMLYLALFPDEGENLLHADVLLNAPNRLTSLLPGTEAWQDVIKVVDSTGIAPEGGHTKLIADALEQKCICYVTSE